MTKKFGIDKRKLHLSNLIVSKQLTRKEALIKIQQLTYPSIEDQDKDIKYFLKKMKWDRNRLDQYLKDPETQHDYYPSERKLWNSLSHIYKFIKRKK